MKFHIITFGCQLNKSDSERIRTELEKIGYKSAPNINGADLIVVNMCSVRQSAVDRINGKIKDFAKLKVKSEKLKVLLTGCTLKSDLKRFKNHFDYILSIKTLSHWKDILLKKEKYVFYPDLRIPRIHKRFQANYFKTIPNYSNNFSAYIPIMTGCNNFCSYCVVPYVRGQEICRPADEIINEVKNLVKKGFNPIRNEFSNGAREIWLFGHNINAYSYRGLNFSELLKRINKIPGDFWISFTSSHPNHFSDELIKIIAESNKISKYISLPIQSGDNKILKKMNRPYTVENYKNLIKKIRKVIPNVSLSTDIIVGFPGETEKQFENTKKLFEELKFDMAYIAEYSPRPGTTAFKMEDNVPKKEKEKRREILTKILEKTSLENSKRYIGKTFDVLVHETTKKGALIGKTHFYKTIKIKNKEDSPPQKLIGKIIQVKIIDAMPWGLEGVF